jgi:hypothetical protein
MVERRVSISLMEGFECPEANAMPRILKIKESMYHGGRNPAPDEV